MPRQGRTGFWQEQATDNKEKWDETSLDSEMEKKNTHNFKPFSYLITKEFQNRIWSRFFHNFTSFSKLT
jgi:hypothetical protein